MSTFFNWLKSKYDNFMEEVSILKQKRSELEDILYSQRNFLVKFKINQNNNHAIGYYNNNEIVVYKINNTIHCCINSINDDSKNIIISSSDPMIDIDTLLSELYYNIFNNK